MTEPVKWKLLDQTPFKIAVSAVTKMAVDRIKAKGCEVISGKLSQQRAKLRNLEKIKNLSWSNQG